MVAPVAEAPSCCHVGTGVSDSGPSRVPAVQARQAGLARSAGAERLTLAASQSRASRCWTACLQVRDEPSVVQLGSSRPAILSSVTRRICLVARFRRARDREQEGATRAP